LLCVDGLLFVAVLCHNRMLKYGILAIYCNTVTFTFVYVKYKQDAKRKIKISFTETNVVRTAG